MTSNDIAEWTMTGAKTADDGVLDDVFSSGRDRGDDSASPETISVGAEEKTSAPLEPPAEPNGTSETPDDGSQPKQYRDPDTGRFVPLHELKTEREKRQDAARRAEEAEKRAKEFETRFQDLERKFQAGQQPQYQQPQAQPRPQPQRPDPWTDPEGALEFERAQILEQAAWQNYETRVALSEMMMAQTPDYMEKKNLAVEAARTNPQLAQMIASNPLPAKAAYEIGRKLATEREIGGDLDAYKKRVEDEVRQKVMAELKAGTTASAQPQRFTQSLADATSAGPQGAILTDEAMLQGVFGSDRRARRK